MKDDRVYLEHIIHCIHLINDYTEYDKFRFMNSQMVQDAVIRNLQTLAESTQRLSPELKTHYPEINWKAIAGFRNILVHDYLGLDLEACWAVIENRLPLLRAQFERLLLGDNLGI